MKTIKYRHTWVLKGTAKQFQKIYNGLDFMNKYPKNKMWKMIIHTDNPLEFLKICWWLYFPPKKPKRIWDPERIPEKYEV